MNGYWVPTAQKQLSIFGAEVLFVLMSNVEKTSLISRVLQHYAEILWYYDYLNLTMLTPFTHRNERAGRRNYYATCLRPNT